MPTQAVKRLIAADPQTIGNLLTDAPPGILTESFEQFADGSDRPPKAGDRHRR